jgi:LETM1 and EF-hand domain-containing protein 1
MGTKLLWLNMKLSSKIVWRSLNGHKMTRRERRVLIRTTSDMFRLVPFAIILIVPFLEFSLPILLKLFPNMLPSTFEDKLQKKEAIKKQLKMKLEMAKFLQDTMKELQPTDEGVEGDFEDFIKKLQNGEMVHPSELIKFAKYFEDEITLDGLERSQLVAMCKLLGASPFGTDAMLRFQLRSRVNQLKRDDMSIREEGVESLTLEELQQAVHARGMPGYHSNNIALLRRRLEDWLELSIDRNLPITLLILSRAFALTFVANNYPSGTVSE